MGKNFVRRSRLEDILYDESGIATGIKLLRIFDDEEVLLEETGNTVQPV